MRSHEILMPFVGFVVVLSGVIQPGTAFADDDLKSQLIDVLTSQWSSREPVEFTEIDVIKSEASGVTTGSVTCEFQIAFDLKGRFSFKSFSDFGTQKHQMDLHLVEDGRYQYKIDYFKYDQKSILVNSVRFRKQASTVNHYDANNMTALLWLLIPGGRPPYLHVIESTSIRREAGPDYPQPLVVVESSHRGGPIEIYLDPGLRYAIRKVKTKNGAFLWEVSDFKQLDGYWFPFHGKSEVRLKSGPTETLSQTHFTVTDAAINKPLRYSSFSPPELTEGAVRVDGTSGQTRLQGDIAYRRLLQKEFEARRLSQANSKTSTKPRVQSSRPLVRMQGILAILSCSIIVIAVRLRKRA
ncbi:hypothetical protein SAMN05444166_2686 [Singulisphaera sp. GP187]|uniref:hypothetical protein n=1 Tax=Singulisphaera sp. GP187 TaxID=1882752 RepID=UPI00092C7656|nr:hypothetical protein [Singulisphaera sp. GP187]SIO14457.1 hypothetical protein SAMN05444166_2686 [Singulisphaera sp. GP187]